jgi:serine/threonine-protein kinase HipA
MKKLSVFYSGWGEHWHLGELADDGINLLFEYSSEALKKGLELSPLNLSLRSEAYGNFPIYQGRLPGLIADSLPDGWGLMLMDRLFKKKGLVLSEISSLDRLAFLGDRAMGALTFAPAFGEKLEVFDFTLTQLAQEINKIIADEPTKALAQIARIGGSPHGARPKALVRFDLKTKTISTDDHAEGAPWLIKFPSEHEHKEVCAIEDLYSELARKCGIEMETTQYFDLGKKLSAFGSLRFDRSKSHKVPLHTAAGALNSNFRLPSVDYISLLRLTRFMTKDQREVEKAFLQCVFNVTFNNRDDHAKNFSFLLDAKKNWKLTPAYDLTFSSGPGGEHQMDICGEGKNPGREHLLMLALKTGVDKKKALFYLDQVCSVALKFREFAKGLDIRSETISEIDRAIQSHRKNLR